MNKKFADGFFLPLLQLAISATLSLSTEPRFRSKIRLAPIFPDIPWSVPYQPRDPELDLTLSNSAFSANQQESSLDLSHLRQQRRDMLDLSIPVYPVDIELQYSGPTQIRIFRIQGLCPAYLKL